MRADLPEPAGLPGLRTDQRLQLHKDQQVQRTVTHTDWDPAGTAVLQAVDTAVQPAADTVADIDGQAVDIAAERVAGIVALQAADSAAVQVADTVSFEQLPYVQTENTDV